MAYYFECDSCNRTIPVDMPDMDDVPRACEDCGQAGCVECMPEGRCDGCQERYSYDLDEAATEDDDEHLIDEY